MCAGVGELCEEKDRIDRHSRHGLQHYLHGIVADTNLRLAALRASGNLLARAYPGQVGPCPTPRNRRLLTIRTGWQPGRAIRCPDNCRCEQNLFPDGLYERFSRVSCREAEPRERIASILGVSGGSPEGGAKAEVPVGIVLERAERMMRLACKESTTI